VRKHQFVYLFLLVSLFSILGFYYMNRRSPVVSCKPSKFISAEDKQYLHPEQIVIKPWRGQHHVYAVFAVDDKYKTDQMIKVTVTDHSSECGTINYINNSYGSPDAPPGHHLVKGYLNTRIALWLIAQGKGDELKQPSSWKLGYVPKQQK
jgi:hypothetical protein